MSARPIATNSRRFATLAAACLVCVALSACGQKSHPTGVDAENQYVDAGPLTYQVQLSRQLNPYATEDRQLLAGVSAPAPTAGQLWFGVWMWAKNQTQQSQTTTDTFDLVDSAGNKYYPVPINAQQNPFVWTSQILAPSQTQPATGTAAGDVPPQGALVLFKLDDSVFSNRPLTLQIYAKGQSTPSTVSLDL